MTREMLLIRRDGRTRQLAVTDQATIGRAPNNHVVIDDQEVSRYHARIERTGSGFRIVDLGSGNGTHLNDALLEPESPAPLRHGDAVRIGPCTLVLQRPQTEQGAGNNAARHRATQILDRPVPFDRAATLSWPVVPSVASAATPAEQGTLKLDMPEQGRLLVGRLPENDLALDHPAVSRFHARISRVDGGYVLEDLDSANGSFVNGARVPEGAALPLATGDIIRIGPFKLTVSAHGLEQADESHDLRLDALHLGQPVGKGANLLQDISLSIRPREFVAVVGVSGAGKSTLLGALNGFRPAREGTVLVNGEDLYRNFDAYRTNLGYVPQDDIIHADLPVERALDYAAQLRLPADTTPEERRRRVQEVMETLGLTERQDVPVRDLSGGQRKRVSIGVELLTRPGLFFLDEATSGLDPGTEAQLMRLLRTLADDGQTVVLVTHATRNVAVCDQVVFLAKGGYLAWYGPPAEALKYFGVDDFDAIYEKLEGELSPAAWAQQFRASPAFRTYVAGRLEDKYGPTLQAPAPKPAPTPATRASSGAGQISRVSAPRQMRILSARYLDIIRRDRMGLILLFLVPALLGAIDLLAWPRDILHPVTGTADRSMTMLFLGTIIPFLVGSLGSAREIVKESAVYRRERMVALRIVPYLLSKLSVAILFSLYSAALLLAARLLAVEIGTDAAGKLYITIVLAVLSGAMWGLLISALARREEQVMMLIVLVVVVQIVFSGGILPLKNLGVAGQVLGSVTSSKWVFEAEVAALKIKSGDCDAAELQGCRLPGIERLETDPERRVLVRQVDERFRDVFGRSLAMSWGAAMAILAGLFTLLVVIQRRKDVRIARA
jgi:ABC transport system ATP-binding/permease protein